MPDISYRIARENDLPRLVDIYNQAIEEGGFTADLEPFTVAQRQSWFDSHQHGAFRIYVVETDGDVAGYLYFSPWRSGRAALRHVAEVSYYLDRNARGKGLGSRLLAHGLELARQSGLRYLLAILLESNVASRGLLEKHGFSLAGTLPEIAELDDATCGQLIMYRQLQEKSK